MTNHPYPLSPIPSFDLDGNGYPIHFLHANGYPPACYQQLFQFLKNEYHVFGMMLRPLWDETRPEEIDDWQSFSEDLRVFLSTYSHGPTTQESPEPVIGIGHSIGAIVTLRAALKYPKKFRALVLLDPVLYVPHRLVEWRVRRARDPLSHPLIQITQNRRRTFKDLDSAFEGFRGKTIFRYLSDEQLWIYIKGITRETENGYELIYSPEWESRIYFTSLQDFDIWNTLQNLRVPALFLRGDETDTFLPDAAELVKQKQPNARVEVVEKSTHIFPLERPKETFEIMQTFFKEVL
jgi:pimeloyl-ACP methyl ester carboxylesterase